MKFSSCVYPCHNGSNVNYNQQNNLSQSDMINSIHPMSLDLYGLSMSPPPPPPPPPSSSSPPPLPPPTDLNSSETTSIDSISKQQTPPVIYPWMRKVHINNPGNKKKRYSNIKGK